MADAAFPRERRLRKRREFMHVQGAPLARARGAHFLVLAAWGVEGALGRLGVVASKKVGCAVRRNRAKRLVREAFRKLESESLRGVDLVVIAHPSLPDSSEPEVRALLVRQVASVVRELERRARSEVSPTGSQPSSSATEERVSPGPAPRAGDAERARGA